LSIDACVFVCVCVGISQEIASGSGLLTGYIAELFPQVTFQPSEWSGMHGTIADLARFTDSMGPVFASIKGNTGAPGAPQTHFPLIASFVQQLLAVAPRKRSPSTGTQPHFLLPSS